MYLLACLQLGRLLCFENRTRFFGDAWHRHCFWVICYVHENIDSPYVFEFWVTNMLREVSMRMFSSLTERINALREPKKTPDVSTGFRPPCWSPSDGLQHGVSILNSIIFSDTLCRITSVRNIAHHRNYGMLFIYYSSTICQFFDSLYWMVSDFIFHLRDN